ncbi:MAG: epoxyqueuosine reductase QueH [Bacteroidales bacterium]|nr:epoxyqueuosine reductase QueH [Bacteroidales bacterium]
MNGLLPEELPQGRLLLHSCCAPCSGAIVEALAGVYCEAARKPSEEMAIFWSNSNICDREEYEKRRVEILRYAALFGIELIDDDFSHEDWLSQVGKGREMAPERGPRCLECFKYRLLRAAKFASENGFGVLTTSLASSRWKSLEQVDEAGRWACAQIGGTVLWWGRNWRKGGLQPRRSEIIKEQGFYNQTFCGCEFSKTL